MQKWLYIVWTAAVGVFGVFAGWWVAVQALFKTEAFELAPSSVETLRDAVFSDVAAAFIVVLIFSVVGTRLIFKRIVK